jgi:hypothetical protein
MPAKQAKTLVVAGLLAALSLAGAGCGPDGLSVGDGFLCVLANGAVKCRGANQYGTIGDGTTIDRTALTQVVGLVDGVTKVVSGRNASCAIASDLSVQCWGRDIGPVPTPVSGLAGVRDVAAGGKSICAIDGTGAVRCWTAGGTPGAPLGSLAGASSIDVVSSDLNPPLVCGVVSGGVSCVNVYGAQPQSVTTLTGQATLVRAGQDTGCAVLTDGRTDCFYNYHGWGEIPSGLPGGASSVAVGATNYCAVVGGTLSCVGGNLLGELGIGTNDPKNSWSKTPHVVQLANVTRVAVSEDTWRTNCALTQSGTTRSVYCWGTPLVGMTPDASPCMVSAPSGQAPYLCVRSPQLVGQLG